MTDNVPAAIAVLKKVSDTARRKQRVSLLPREFDGHAWQTK